MVLADGHRPRPTEFEDDVAPERSLVRFSATIYKNASPMDFRMQFFVVLRLGGSIPGIHGTFSLLPVISLSSKTGCPSKSLIIETRLAEVAVPRELFRAILEGIGRLRLIVAASGQMKSERTRMKTTETTEEVTSDGMAKRANRRKRQRSAPIVREQRRVDWKK